jgi:O-antigen ligase
MPPKSLTRNWSNSVVLLLAFVAINIVNQHVAGDPFREGKMIIFIFTALVAGCFWVARRFDPWLAAVIGIASAEWAFANGPVYGILPTAGVLGFLYLGHIASENRWLALWILRVSTWLQAVFCVLQICHVQTFGSMDPNFIGSITGNMGHPIVVGAWLAACAPLAYFYWSRVEFMICVALALYSGSTMAVMALFAGGAYVWCRRMPILWLGIPLAAVMLGIGVWFFPQVEFFSLSGRMLPWKVAYEWILKSPWVGYGPGSWAGLYPTWKVEYSRVWDFQHNDWLQLCFELGVPVLLISLASAVSILNKMSLAYGACLVALMVNALGAFPFHLASLGFLTCCVLGMGINNPDDKEKIS